MRFKTIDNYHAESPEGYRISVCFVGGEKVYQAWTKNERSKWELIDSSVSKSKKHVIQTVSTHYNEIKKLSSRAS